MKLGGGPDASDRTFPDYMQAKAQVDDATRNLNYAYVKAPIDGVATQVSQIELGRVAPAGQAVFAIVADTGLWVDANPKESDLTYVQGRPACDSDDRHLSRPRVEGRRLLDCSRHWRAVCDPAAAERERQLGQGRAAHSPALLLCCR